MKITLEQYDEKYTVEISNDDVNQEELKQMLRAILALSSWGCEQINKMIVEEEK